jgi:hypothetical protein
VEQGFAKLIDLRMLMLTVQDSASKGGKVSCWSMAVGSLVIDLPMSSQQR